MVSIYCHLFNYSSHHNTYSSVCDKIKLMKPTAVSPQPFFNRGTLLFCTEHNSCTDGWSGISDVEPKMYLAILDCELMLLSISERCCCAPGFHSVFLEKGGITGPGLVSGLGRLILLRKRLNL